MAHMAGKAGFGSCVVGDGFDSILFVAAVTHLRAGFLKQMLVLACMRVVTE
jgi:hypothetical protein